MSKKFAKLFTIGIVFLISCIDPYNPPQVEQENSYLVVDGYVDMSEGKSSITLSRTVNLADPNTIVPQTGAQVRVLFENGTTYNLYEVEAGRYYAEGLSVTENDKCRLLISGNGIDYESDVVSVKETPDIDSVTYHADDTGVSVEVTTHDPNNNTWYYQWQYEETARYQSKFRSLYYWRGPNDFASRTGENDIYVCWKTIPSTEILIGTSANLKEDVIYKYPLAFIPSTSWMLEYRYSILVRQYAIDKDAYNYWLQLKKNTESLGTLFDPLPSEVTGNIRCIDDPSEPVLGYFSVRSIREKRIYIDASDLPDYRDIENGYEDCRYDEIDTLLFEDLTQGEPTGYLLISPATEPPMGITVIGYSTHYARCIDCRIVRGGTTKKPEWWEE